MLDQRRMSMNPSKAPSLWRAADSGALVVIDLRDGDVTHRPHQGGHGRGILWRNQTGA